MEFGEHLGRVSGRFVWNTCGWRDAVQDGEKLPKLLGDALPMLMSGWVALATQSLDAPMGEKQQISILSLAYEIRTRNGQGQPIGDPWHDFRLDSKPGRYIRLAGDADDPLLTGGVRPMIGAASERCDRERFAKLRMDQLASLGGQHAASLRYLRSGA
jgi:hypothetical protein